MVIGSSVELIVYKKAYDLAMKIFAASKRFPKEETFALTGQIRRSSRSVCMNLREAWAKRRYINEDEHDDLMALCKEVGRMLGTMIRSPDSFLLTSDL